MIVAFEASHGGAQEGLSHGVHDVVEVQLTGLRFENHCRVPWANPQKGRGYQQLRILFPRRLFFPKLVSCDLFDYELVVGFVLIEGASHIVAISPHIGSLVVIGQTGGISVAGDVQPMLSGSFTEVRTVQ